MLETVFELLEEQGVTLFALLYMNILVVCKLEQEALRLKIYQHPSIE